MFEIDRVLVLPIDPHSVTQRLDIKMLEMCEELLKFKPMRQRDGTITGGLQYVDYKELTSLKRGTRRFHVKKAYSLRDRINL